MQQIHGENFRLYGQALFAPIRSPSYYIDSTILSCLDEPSSSGDVRHAGVEPSHPVEEEKENQVAETKLEPGALELYRSESQMLKLAHDDVHKSILKSGTVVYYCTVENFQGRKHSQISWF